MRKLRLSSSTNLLLREEGKICENITAVNLFAKELGFDALDFSFCVPALGEDGFEKYVECAISVSENTGVKYEVCHLPFDGKIALDPSRIPVLDKRIHNALKGAKMLGVGYAVIHPNTTTVEKIKFDEEDSFNSVISYLAPYVERAEREGVKLLVENMRPVNKAGLVHRYCMEPDELCRVADKLGIGVCWDFGHANIAGIRQSRALEYVGSRLKLLHVNDNFAVDDEHLIPFHGNIDWKDAMHGLSLAGYEGLFNFELNTSRLPASVRRTYASHVVEVAQELMTYIK